MMCGMCTVSASDVRADSLQQLNDATFSFSRACVVVLSCCRAFVVLPFLHSVRQQTVSSEYTRARSDGSHPLMTLSIMFLVAPWLSRTVLCCSHGGYFRSVPFRILGVSAGRRRPLHARQPDAQANSTIQLSTASCAWCVLLLAVLLPATCPVSSAIATLRKCT